MACRGVVCPSTKVAPFRGPSPYWSSNGGPGLDLFAPGTEILSAYRGVRDAQGVVTGTSMAAPHVAGAVALMRQLHPTAPVEVMEQCLRADTKRTIARYGLSRPVLDVPPRNTRAEQR